MPRPSPIPRRGDVPSEYVRLEAQLASATRGDEAASLTSPRPLVLVAEADPDLRAWVARGLAEHGTADAPAFRVETVATAEHLIEFMEREDIAVVLCGHLVPPADWQALLDRLRGTSTEWCVLVEHTERGPNDALQELGRTVRLAEAVARLLQRTPGRTASTITPPTVH